MLKVGRQNEALQQTRHFMGGWMDWRVERTNTSRVYGNDLFSAASDHEDSIQSLRQNLQVFHVWRMNSQGKYICIVSVYTCKELAGTSRPVRVKRWLGLIMDVWRGFYGSNSQINQLLLYNSLRGALQILQFMNEWKGLKFIQKITTTFNANPQIYIP